MAVFAGTSILNTGGTAADQPGSTPILLVPAGGSANIVGFALTNPLNSPIVVSVYRDVIGAAGLLFTQTVPALAGMVGGPAAVQVAQSLSLTAGEAIYAVSVNQGGWVNVEIDGNTGAVTGGLVTNQLLQALILMTHEAYGVDIPDANTLNGGYTFT
jgi:hypothetical protein